MPSVSVLVPCYKRPEYTALCIKALEDAQSYENTTFHLWDDSSQDGTIEILNSSNLQKEVHKNESNEGLRSTLIKFIELSRNKYDFLSVVGNDCLMPKNWLTDILHKFETTDADILSPNVMPSNAAFKYGQDDKQKLGYRLSKIVGGLWTLRSSLIEDMDFAQYGVSGITGAFNILSQIITEKQPKIGWLPEITVQDIGHWSGQHELNIKSEDHRRYYAEVGRNIAW